MSKPGPFGFSMSMTLQDLSSEVDEISPNRYIVKSVPKPHSAFETYIVSLCPKVGLYAIRAISSTIDTNAYGSELIAKYDSMKEKLGLAYGKHELYEFLMHDSIWNEPRDWMQSLLSKERVMSAEWKKEHGSNVGELLDTVFLQSAAVDTSSGFIALEYIFKNSRVAEAELAAREDDVL